jgi:YqcI/YcgG family protein
MIHALPTAEFIKAVEEFDHHARAGRQQVSTKPFREGAWRLERPWNPLHQDAKAARLSSLPAWRPGARRLGVRTGLYPEMGTPEAALAVCHDLYEFAHEVSEGGQAHGACFVALFKGPAIDSRVHFEHLLWRQLQTMQGVDAQHFPAAEQPPGGDDAAVLASFGGRAYTVVGQRDGEAGLARPSLAFYPREGALR